MFQQRHTQKPRWWAAVLSSEREAWVSVLPSEVMRVLLDERPDVSLRQKEEDSASWVVWVKNGKEMTSKIWLATKQLFIYLETVQKKIGLKLVEYTKLLKICKELGVISEGCKLISIIMYCSSYCGLSRRDRYSLSSRHTTSKVTRLLNRYSLTWPTLVRSHLQLWRICFCLK